MIATARLENWYKAGRVIFGEIHGDTRGRFSDGTHVQTSIVKEIKDGYALTLNSVYELGKPYNV